LEFKGPFLGLNDTLDVSRVGMSYARKARNVILSEQSVRPRAPWDAANAFIGDFEEIVGLYEWTPPALLTAGVAAASQILSKHGSAGIVGAGTQGGRLRYSNHVIQNEGAPTHITQQIGSSILSQNPASFVRYEKFVYVVDGSSGDIFKTDGINLFLAGIYPPVGETLTSASPTSGAGIEIHFHNPGHAAPKAQVSYRATFYDSVNGVESNAYETPIFRKGDGDIITINLLPYGISLPADRGIDRVRIYRRNHTLGEVGWRLILDLPAVAAAVQDNVDTSTIALEDADLQGISTLENGPFAPSKNGVPINAVVATIWKERMFYYRFDKPGKLFYSAIGKPDHCDANDFLKVSGDQDDKIRGLMGFGGTLVAGKRKGFRAITGEILGETNETIATGAVPLETSIHTQEFPDQPGPVNENGNGFFMGGDPVRVYFAGDSGFYMYDGVEPRKLSEAIKDTWQRMVAPAPFATAPDTNVRAGVKFFSYADDRHDGIIYIMPLYGDLKNHGYTAVPAPQNQGLAYHYKIGGWSTVDGGGLLISDFQGLGLGLPATIRCVASAETYRGTSFPDSQEDLRTPGVLWGLDDGLICRSRRTSTFGSTGQTADEDADALRVPDWEYETGAMQLNEGAAIVLLWIRWLFSDAAAFDGGPPDVLFEAVINEDLLGSVVVPMTTSIADVSGPHKLQRIARRARKLGLRMRRSPGWLNGWTEKLGVTGWQIRFDPVGQR